MEQRKCEECSSWAESMYWIHFQCMHFCQILDGDFHSQLTIPKKFSENAREKLQETVTLKGPSGTATWQVKLMATDDALVLKDGWREFLSAFSVEKNDILMFKYTGNSCFHVLIFDRQSLCEKESSYFIRKCGHSEPCKTEQEKQFVKESPEEVSQDNSLKNFESIPPKKHKGEAFMEKELSLQERIPLGVPDVSELKAPCANIGAPREGPRTRQISSWDWEPVKLPPVAEKQKTAKKEPKADLLTLKSRRRLVTEKEKKKALQMASKELTEDSFVVVMRPSHVYKKFFLTLPAEWIAKHLMIYEKQPVRLQANEKMWLTRLIFCTNGRGGLSCGWKEFSIDNGLEEFDVCVFKLASKKHEPVLLDVGIFRVVPVEVESSRVSPTFKTNSSRRKLRSSDAV